MDNHGPAGGSAQARELLEVVTVPQHNQMYSWRSGADKLLEQAFEVASGSDTTVVEEIAAALGQIQVGADVDAGSVFGVAPTKHRRVIEHAWRTRRHVLADQVVLKPLGHGERQIGAFEAAFFVDFHHPPLSGREESLLHIQLV